MVPAQKTLLSTTRQRFRNIGICYTQSRCQPRYKIIQGEDTAIVIGSLRRPNIVLPRWHFLSLPRNDATCPTSTSVVLSVLFAESWATENPKTANKKVSQHTSKTQAMANRKRKSVNAPCDPNRPAPWHRGMLKLNLKLCPTGRICAKHLQQKCKEPKVCTSCVKQSKRWRQKTMWSSTKIRVMSHQAVWC